MPEKDHCGMCDGPFPCLKHGTAYPYSSMERPVLPQGRAAMSPPDTAKLVAEMREAFALNVRRMREARGWTQVELARRAGLHEKQVDHYENRRRSPGFRTIARFALAFGCAPFELL